MLCWCFPAIAKTPSLHETRAALAAAEQRQAAHRQAAAKARAQAVAQDEKAAMLAAEQVQMAAALRGLETRTGAAADRLAALNAQSAAAAAQLRQTQAALTRLLPVMQRLAAQPAATMLAVPQSPEDAVRAILVMQGIARQIEQQAEAAKQQTAELAMLASQAAAQGRALAAASALQQQAETALDRQIAAAKATEMADAQAGLVQQAAALAATHDIVGLNDIIARLQAAPKPPALPRMAGVAPPPGAPVAGVVVQKFGAATLAGPAAGISYRAAPAARVAAPCAGPVLFADHFQSYGLVVILDCGDGYDFVLSGMQRLDVAAGQRVADGQPVGEMPGLDPKNPAAQPVLYEELRHGGATIDPSSWPAAGRSG